MKEISFPSSAHNYARIFISEILPVNTFLLVDFRSSEYQVVVAELDQVGFLLS